MSSFGDGNNKTRIEQELSYIYREYYSNDEEAKKQFILDVLDVIRYICEDY